MFSVFLQLLVAKRDYLKPYSTMTGQVPRKTGDMKHRGETETYWLSDAPTAHIDIPRALGLHNYKNHARRAQ